MKRLLFILFCIPTLSAFAQDTTYYNAYNSEVNTFAEANYYQVINQDPADTNKISENTYFKSGQLRSVRDYTKDTSGLINGRELDYFESGQLQAQISYTKSEFDSTLTTYWESGKPKRIDHFRAGKLINGKCFTADGKATVHKPFQVLPEFPGGENALLAFLRKKVKYPKKAQKHNIDGVVVVDFVIDKNGKVTDPHIIKGTNADLNAEALKVVRAMPHWKPGSQDGDAVNVDFKLPIRFRLE